MAAYSYLFGMAIACLSYVVYQRNSNFQTSIVTKPDKRYDYIIVGAGTSGCVLAARLSENPRTKVLLIEAGDHMGYFTKIPLTPTAAQLGPNDWSVRTTRQKYSSFGLWDQTQLLPRGKGLGGSGQINFLQHGLGFTEDYDRWVQRGFKGWSLEDLKPYFIKAFGSSSSEFDSDDCSVDGYCPGRKAPMKMKLLSEDNDLMKTFKKASKELNNKYTFFKKPSATIKNGVRHSTLDAYLNPVLTRKNLHVLINTQAISIRFENQTASSLYILKNHRNLDNVFVNKGIILCAGAVKTPQILMLSGIGPRDLIQRLKIKLISHNGHVGQNLHDHMNMPVFISISKPISVSLAKVFSFQTIWDYYRNSKGLLSFPPVAGVEFQNSSAVKLFSMGTASERLLRDLSNYIPKTFRETFPFHNDTHKEGFMFLATCVHPRSRGSITLTEASTAVPPVVDTNYLEQAWDVRCMIRALRRIEQLVSTKAFQAIGARIHWPRPERCLTFWNYSRQDQIGTVQRRRKKIKNTSTPHQKPIKPHQNNNSNPKEKSPPSEYLECILREVAVTGHHVGGTCAGGTVVDDQLRVKSVSGVSVMDASVFPSPPSLYPNSVLIAMAEKAAEIIKKAGRTNCK